MIAMSEKQFSKWLVELVKKHGSQLALAKEIGVSPQYVSAVMAGQRKAGSRFLRGMGLKRQVIYVQDMNVKEKA